MEYVVRIPLFKDKIEPYQYNWLCSLFREQTKQIIDETEEQIQKIKAEREEKLRELNAAQNAISEIFLKHYSVCPECLGEGNIIEYDHMHDERGHSAKCKNCNGRGYLEKVAK